MGSKPAKAIELKELDEFLLARAMEHDAPSLLFRLGRSPRPPPGMSCLRYGQAVTVSPGPVPQVPLPGPPLRVSVPLPPLIMSLLDPA